MEQVAPGIEARALIEACFAAGSDAAVVVDAEGTIVLSSPAVTTLFGYEPQELTGRSVEELVPDGAREIHPTHRKGFVEAERARHMGSGLQLHGRTRDGREIPVDVSLAPINVAGVQFSLALVRDARDRVRSVRQAEAVGEVAEFLLSGASPEDSLALIISRARALAEAAAAWLVMSQPDGPIKVIAADGHGAEALLGFELPPTSRSGWVLSEGELDIVDLQVADGVPERIRALGLGPAIYMPLGTENPGKGVLVIARSTEAPPFENFDVNLVKVFAAATAATLRTGHTRRTAETSRLVAEQERIGGSLLDSSIQEAFQVGLVLAAIRPMAAPAVAPRLDEATERLDELIRNLREAVFRGGDQ